MKTKPTGASVKDFIAAVENDTRRQDAQTLVKLCKKVSGWNAYMLGPTIIGFGTRHYTYASGRSGSVCALGFSPRKANLVFYLSGFPGKEDLLNKLGKHQGGIKSCLYINKLADIDLKVLEKLLKESVTTAKKSGNVTAT
jgi:hypothetical protein